MHTLIAFPNAISAVTGIAYLRVGNRKVQATLINGKTYSIGRKAFPAVLPEGNALAFTTAKLFHDSWKEIKVCSNPMADANEDCQWSLCTDGWWSTPCGNKGKFTIGGPSENNCNFCMYWLLDLFLPVNL